MKYLLFIIAFIPLVVWGQDSLGLDPGLLFDDSTFMLIPEYPAVERSRAAGQSIDLRAYCPTPGDQCDDGSCVGWAIAHARTIRWAWGTNQTDRKKIDQHLFSPAYIYNQIKEGADCKSGAYLHKGLELVEKQGHNLLSSFSTKCNDCNRLPNKAQQEAATVHKITGSKRVFSPGDSSNVILQSLLSALDWHNPVIVGMLITPNFHACRQGHGPWRPYPLGGGTEGHALVVVGYDEDARMLTLFNSYGPDWGDRGFIQMAFDDFVNQAKYGVVMK